MPQATLPAVGKSVFVQHGGVVWVFDKCLMCVKLYLMEGQALPISAVHTMCCCLKAKMEILFLKGYPTHKVIRIV